MLFLGYLVNQFYITANAVRLTQFIYVIQNSLDQDPVGRHWHGTFIGVNTHWVGRVV